MSDSTDSVSIDMETTSVTTKEHLVKTSSGFVSVSIFGDQDKPALVTYPDLALNRLFLCPEAFSLLIHNFCIYHISPPGHELGAAAMSYNDPPLSVDDLADQVAEVVDFFRVLSPAGLITQTRCGYVPGSTPGAYILTLFAIKYRRHMLGLVLVSPLCKPPSWTEWLCNMVSDKDHPSAKITTTGIKFVIIEPLGPSLQYLQTTRTNQLMANMLYYYGMCGIIKELLLIRYFSKEVVEEL